MVLGMREFTVGAVQCGSNRAPLSWVFLPTMILLLFSVRNIDKIDLIVCEEFCMFCLFQITLVCLNKKKRGNKSS